MQAFAVSGWLCRFVLRGNSRRTRGNDMFEHFGFFFQVGGAGVCLVVGFWKFRNI